MIGPIENLLSTAKAACHTIWIDRDVFKFKNYCTPDADITGFAETDKVENGQFGYVNIFPFLQNTSISYEIISEEYSNSTIIGNVYIVICNIHLKGKKYDTERELRIFTTLIFDTSGDTPLIANAHFSSPDDISFEKEVIQIPINNSSDSSVLNDELAEYYRDLIFNDCDLFIECDIKDYVLKYDRDKYFHLFDDDSYFTNPDRWFWNMCNTCVHPEDYERVDIFRKVDIEKRKRNNINTVETTFRIKNHKYGYIWIKLQVINKLNDDNELEKMALIFRRLENKDFNELEYIEKSRRDELTGLYNKKYSEYLINSFLENYNKNATTAFVVIDIDDFRKVNDTFGHITGDSILVQIARSFSTFFATNDITGRLVGDKFCVLINSLPNEYEVTKSIDNFLKRMNHTHCELGTSLDVHCSAGIVFLNDTYTSYADLFDSALQALKTAKDKGKNRYEISLY